MNTKQPTKKALTSFVTAWLATHAFNVSNNRLIELDNAIDACIDAYVDQHECELNDKSVELVSGLIDTALQAAEKAACERHAELPQADEPKLIIEPKPEPKAATMTAAQALQLLLVPSVERAEKAVKIEQKPATLDTVIELQGSINLTNGVTLNVNPNVNINMRTGLPVKYDIVPPKRAGKCYDVWVKCADLVAAGITPTSKLIDAWSIECGYNVQNGRIELYRFLKYYGIAKVA